MRLVIYTRVSSKEQVDGFSLEAQKELCEKWAEENSHEVIKIFSDEGKSGRTDDRKEFQKAVKYVLTGGADGILIHKIDRFARDMGDLLIYYNQLIKNDKHFLSVSESFVNQVSAEGKLMLGVYGLISEYFSNNLSSEIKKGQRMKARLGKYPGGVLHFGYIRNDDKEIVPHPEYGKLVTQAFHEYAHEEYNLRSWNKEAKKRGAPNQMHPQTWHKILRNRFYMGEFKWGKEIYQGDHEPLTDEETFEKVQEKLTKQSKNGNQKQNFWLLSGLLWSEPEQKRMHGSIAKKKYRYYVARKHYVRAEDLEERVEEKMKYIYGYNDRLHNKYKLAIRVANNMSDVWKELGDRQRKEFLVSVILPAGITVSLGGAIVDMKLIPGFKLTS